jgi:hypothetical protein
LCRTHRANPPFFARTIGTRSRVRTVRPHRRLRTFRSTCCKRVCRPH